MRRLKKLDAAEQKRLNKEIQQMYKKEKKMEKEARTKAQTNGQTSIKKQNKTIPVPDDSTSSLQMNKPKSKAGFCYIGEDRGFRSCIEVGEGDVCMSGDIFPTEAVCVNPKLRI